MIYKFTIKGSLPNLNDYLQAERQSFRGSKEHYNTKGNLMKKEAQSLIIPTIRKQIGKVDIKAPIEIHYDIYEKNRKRDLDNVLAFAMKVTQDSLVLAGVLPNDGWNEISKISSSFYVDKENPRIEVSLIEVDADGYLIEQLPF